jgi:hypothetical protein
MKENYVATGIVPEGGWGEGSVDFLALRDDEEGFRIVVSTRQGEKVVIRFQRPMAYRNCDEGKRLRTLGEVKLSGEAIYRVEGSRFAEWLHEESGYTGEMGATTYAVVTQNDWIEVIAFAPPTVGLGWE